MLATRLSVAGADCAASTCPNALQPLMIWSRFLMGGGGLALGVLFGGLAIALAASHKQVSV
jgi:hypothetical protein